MRLNIAFDERYPVIVEEAIAATTLVMPWSKASVAAHPVDRYVWLNRTRSIGFVYFPNPAWGASIDGGLRSNSGNAKSGAASEGLSIPTGADS